LHYRKKKKIYYIQTSPRAERIISSWLQATYDFAQPENCACNSPKDTLLCEAGYEPNILKAVYLPQFLSSTQVDVDSRNLIIRPLCSFHF
jgi:hypothetical protein